MNELNNKLKIGFISDIHGKTIWKEFIKDEAVDHWVFLGDYVDHDFGYNISDEDMIENLEDIIKFKRDNMLTVSLLTGNHCDSYININDLTHRCSRFRSSIGLELSDLYNFNKDCFQNAWQYKNIIATHAGIQHNWFVNCFKGNIENDIAYQLNNTVDENQKESLYDVGWSRGGSKYVGGIFWCDRKELIKPLKGFTQVVGHNRVEKITHIERKGYGDVYFCDCLNYEKKFLTLEI